MKRLFERYIFQSLPEYSGNNDVLIEREVIINARKLFNNRDKEFDENIKRLKKGKPPLVIEIPPDIDWGLSEVTW